MQDEHVKDFGPWFWVHVVLLLIAYASPLLADWRIILIGVAVLQIQYWMIGGCYITHLERGKDSREVFWWYYLRKIWPNIRADHTKFVVRIVVPIIIVGIAFILQTHIGYTPPLSW